MTDTILVTWASRYGATQEVAETVAATLRQSGLAVETRPTRDVETLETYSAVVVGCALYMGRMHREARRFLAVHPSSLSARPVAMFVLGPVHREEKEWQGARAQLTKELSRFPWLNPVAVEVFGGRWDVSKMGFPFGWLPGVRRMPVSDARDWEAIRKWAEAVAPMLHGASVGR